MISLSSLLNLGNLVSMARFDEAHNASVHRRYDKNTDSMVDIRSGDDEPPPQYWNNRDRFMGVFRGLGEGNVMYCPGVRDADIGSELQHCVVYYAYGGIKEQQFSKVANMVFPLPDGIMDEVGLEWNVEESGQMKMRAMLNTFITEGKMSAAKEIYGEAKAGMNEMIAKITGGARTRRDKGIVKNTHQEMYFKGLNFRQFSFKHKMMPTSKSEADDTKQIVDSFKYLASPGWDTGRKYFTYPSQWEIHFLHRKGNVMSDNDHITKIGRCVLDKVGVNYTSEGTYQSFEGGEPTSVELELSFKEIDLVTKGTLHENERAGGMTGGFGGSIGGGMV